MQSFLFKPQKLAEILVSIVRPIFDDSHHLPKVINNSIMIFQKPHYCFFIRDKSLGTK